MTSKFSEFLKTNSIDPRRIISASTELERLRPEDRAIRLARRQSKGKDTPAAADGEKKAPEKRRSGKPVTRRALTSATAGKPLAGPQKTRILRAVNRILEQKKKDPVALQALF